MDVSADKQSRFSATDTWMVEMKTTDVGGGCQIFHILKCASTTPNGAYTKVMKHIKAECLAVPTDLHIERLNSQT